jgi:DNA primase
MDGKDAFIKECIALFSTVQSAVEKELYIGRAAEISGLPADVIRIQTEKTTAREKRREQKESLDREMQKARGLGNRINPDKAKFVSAAAKEENIVGILLLRREYLLDATLRPIIRPELFSCEFLKRALETMLAQTEVEEGVPFAALNEFFTPEEMGELEGMKKKREQLGNNSPAILKELFERLEEEKKKKESKAEPLSGDWLKKLKAEKSGKDQNS